VEGQSFEGAGGAELDQGEGREEGRILAIPGEGRNRSSKGPPGFFSNLAGLTIGLTGNPIANSYVAVPVDPRGPGESPDRRGDRPSGPPRT